MFAELQQPRLSSWRLRGLKVLHPWGQLAGFSPGPPRGLSAADWSREATGQ